LGLFFGFNGGVGVHSPPGGRVHGGIFPAFWRAERKAGGARGKDFISRKGGNGGPPAFAAGIDCFFPGFSFRLLYFGARVATLWAGRYPPAKTVGFLRVLAGVRKGVSPLALFFGLLEGGGI